jgi:hypothetical protein
MSCDNTLGYYIAQLLVHFDISESAQTVLHKNYVVIEADSAVSALSRANQLGKKYNMQYRNTKGEAVTVRFAGVAELSRVHDDIEDGAELMYEAFDGMSLKAAQALNLDKDQMSAFRETHRRKIAPE